MTDTSELEHALGEGPASEAAPSRRGLLVPGTVVDHFRVTRLVGRGGMGEVYAARDLKLGRRVALKVIAPGHFESASMRERFLVEAQTTARFSHPNIVTIYAVGEYEGRPYLALEYLEGVTLLERMRERRLGPGEALRIALAVAEALAEAHAHGVSHRDLKPANIHLDRDGRVRVLDFGLAKVQTDADAPPPSSYSIDESSVHDSASLDALASKTFGVGTPAYMAPEQWREEGGTAATDVWSFGVVLFTMLTGRLPFVATSLQELALEVCSDASAPRVREHTAAPAPLDELVAACLTKRAESRPTAAGLVGALRAQVDGRGRALGEGASPFRGLLAFTREHESTFFGRDAEISAFVERVRTECVLPVVGASGSGKSSFVQAGVIPRLCEQDRWTVLSVRVGGDPFVALAARLLDGEERSGTSDLSGGSGGPHDAPTRPRRAQALEPLGEDAARPAGDDSGATRLTLAPGDGAAPRSSTPPERASQRERRHSLTSSGLHRRDVLELAGRLREHPGILAFELRAVADARGSRVLLFLDQLEELFTLGAPDEVARAFVEMIAAATDDPQDPVRVVLTIRDDFFGRLAVSARVAAALGRVTLMQRPDARALEEVLVGPLRAVGYDYEDPDLPREMVRAVKDEPSCLPLLQFTANLLWERRDREQKRLTREAYAELGGVEGALARHADGVLAGLSADELVAVRKLLLRLVTSERTRKVIPKATALEGLHAAGDAVLERLTEARLITTTKWLDPKATTVLELAHESLIRDWGTLRRWIDESHEDLVIAGQLEQAARLWEERGRVAELLWSGDALGEVRRLLGRSKLELTAATRAFVAASEALESGRIRRRRRLGAGAFALAGVVAVGSAIAAFTIAGERDRAERGRAEALREGARAAMAQGQLLEARAKLREALEVEDSVAGRVLWRQLVENPLEWTAGLGARVYAVAVSPDGSLVATGGSDGVVTLFDAVTRERRALRGHTDQVLSLAFSPDGATLVSSSLDRTARLWDPRRGVLVRALKGHRDAVHTARFSPDGRAVFAGSYSGELRVWSVADGRELHAWRGHDTPVRGVSWSPDGRTLASGDAAGMVKLWDASTFGAAGELAGNERTVVGVVFRPDGAELATSSLDGTVRLFDVAERKQRAVLRGHGGGLFKLAYSSDGKRLASAGGDRVVHVWDDATHALVQSYPLAGEATDVAFSRDGSRLAIVGTHEEVAYYRTSPPPNAAIRGHDAVVNQAVASPDGALVASVSSDGRVLLRDATSGAVVRTFVAHAAAANTLSFTPDGQRLVTGGGDGTLRLWSRGGESLGTLLTHSSALYAVAVSPDGRTVLAGAHDGAVLAVDVPTGTARRLATAQDRLRTVAVDASGRFGVSAGHDGHLRTFDLADGVLRKDVDVGHGRLYGASIHPGARSVAVACADGTIARVDLESGAVAELAKAEGRCYGLAHTPGGERLVVPCADGTLRLVEDGKGFVAKLALHENEANTANVTRDGRAVVTASDDFTVQVVDLDTFEPRWHLDALVPRPGGGAAVHGHRGWTTPSTEAAPPVDTGWGRAAADAVASRVSRDGRRLCVLRRRGGLELHDLPGDHLLGTLEGRPRTFAATAAGCVAAFDDALVRLDGGAPLRVEGKGVVALGESDEGVVAATSEKLLVLDAALAERRSFPSSGGVTALAATRDTLLVGHHDGHLERRRIDGSSVLELEGASASPALAIAPGPAGIWVVGFGNGNVGLWAGDDLRRLDRARLHGPVGALLVESGMLHAATRRGDGLSLDLRVLESPRCDLLRAVGASVPVTWRDGRAVLTPPTEGLCR